MTIANAAACDAEITAPAALSGFRSLRLRRSGARPARRMVADVWAGAAETSCADDAVVRQEVRLYVDSNGLPLLHIFGERREAGELAAWRAVLIDAGEDIPDAIAAYDPACLTAGLNRIAAFATFDEGVLRGFADEASAIKRDFKSLVSVLGKPNIQ